MKETDQSNSRPKSMPNPAAPEVDIGTMTSITRASYLNQGFIADENDNWSDIALQACSGSLQVPTQLQSDQIPGHQSDTMDNVQSGQESKQSRTDAVKKYLKDVNERIIKKDQTKVKKKDSWSAVITSVMSNFLFILSLILTVILPFVLFIIGLIHFNKCPIIPSLPFLLIAIGLLITLSNIVNAVDSVTSEEPFGMNHNLKKVLVSTINIVFNSFVIVALVILVAWITFHSKPVFKKIDTLIQPESNETTVVSTTIGSTSNNNYCHPLVYSTCLYISYTVSFLFVLTLLMSIIKYTVKQIMDRKNDPDEEDDDERQSDEDEKPRCTQQ